MADEKRLIDAIALISKARRMETTDNNGIPVDTFAVPVMAIEDAPTVDAVEVKHGLWHEVPYIDKIACSVCGQHWSIIDNCTETFNYCPNCGARIA